jgi:hypothetical protein
LGRDALNILRLLHESKPVPMSSTVSLLMYLNMIDRRLKLTEAGRQALHKYPLTENSAGKISA